MQQYAWTLYYGADKYLPLSGLEEAFAAVCGAPVTKRVGEATGDPYNGYGREISLRATASDGSFALESALNLQVGTTDDREPVLLNDAGVSVSSSSPEPSLRLAAWERLSAELASRGFRDDTWVKGPRGIVEAVERSGDRARGAAMRRAITEALVLRAPSCRWVALWGTCPDDLGAVLRAYERPEAIDSVSFTDLDLEALPPDLARFTGVVNLSLREKRLPPSALRGWSFSRLAELHLSGANIVRIEADDLRGLPALRSLEVGSYALRALDPAIREACPKLERVLLRGTALSDDADAVAALRERWPGVNIQGA